MGFKGKQSNSCTDYTRKRFNKAAQNIYIEPDSLDPQVLEEKELDTKDPSFKRELAELDKRLKQVEDPDEAWLMIETSFLRDYDDFEVETKIYQMEIAHGTKILVNQ
jgi:hypothetical protein